MQTKIKDFFVSIFQPYQTYIATSDQEISFETYGQFISAYLLDFYDIRFFLIIPFHNFQTASGQPKKYFEAKKKESFKKKFTL